MNNVMEYQTIIHQSGIIVLVYTRQAEQLADQRVTLFMTIYRRKPKAILFSSAACR